MKLLCDQMLIKLGRWLRFAGYDTAIVDESMDDRTIINLAKEEGRIIVTRDRQMANLPGARDITICLMHNRTVDCAKELSEKAPVDWTYRPFSRCSLCNEPLIERDPPTASEVPTQVLENQDKFWSCPKCQKIYWLGTHTDRLLQTLQHLKN